ncbi:MAG: hypothetical protein AB8H80_03270 [Planctomycetota bacterium]
MRSLCSPILFAVAFGLTMFAGAASALRAQSVQLADGRVMLANVIEADGDGLRVRRLDNGGMLDLRWDHLSVASSTQIKKKFELIGSGQDQLMARADEVRYLLSGTRQSVIGRIVNPTADPLVVSVKGVNYPVPRGNLLGVSKIDVPATQVYTKDEFYAEKLSEMVPGDKANRHMLLAEELIKFRDYDRAAEHLKLAEELDNADDKNKLATLVDRLKRFKEAAKELGMLEQLQIARSRGKLKDFERGREVIETFAKQFPRSKLKAEFEREEKRFEQARSRFLAQRVSDQWRRSIATVADKHVAGDGSTLQAARAYAENGMRDDIVARLAKQLELPNEEILDLWSQRESFPVGKRSEHFSYGVGSWVLGAKEIIKDTAVGGAEAKREGATKQAGSSREIDRFTKALRQAMQRRQRAQQSGAEKRDQTDEGWWQSATRKERVSWLRAYYAEYGGDLKLDFASAQQCISCYGAGTTPEMNGNGQMVRAKCFLCQQTKYVRSFKAH